MLILSLNIGKERYGINASSVIEIVPLIELNKVPLADPCIKGIFNYRGEPTPVIDLCRLFENRDCQQTLSSRIVIIKIKEMHTVGLAAEMITDVIRCEEDEINHNGIKTQENSGLKKIIHHNNEMIQLIETQNILTESINQQILSKFN